MARLKNAPAEKLLFWIGSAKSDLLKFPDAVQDEIGIALSVAQFGGKHPKAKPWKGEGPGILEIVIKTAHADVEMISRRLKTASEDYEARYGKRET